MDVDGTLTDGKIYMSATGELFKAFDIKDGYGIYALLRKNNIEPVIITGRSSEIVKYRCAELKIELVYQGISDKLAKMNEILVEQSLKDGTEYTLAECAYVGDDLPDLEIMEAINNAGGLSACPADAVNEVLNVSTYKASKKGGEGAVREIIEYLIK